MTSDDVTLIVEKNGTPVGGEQVIARDFVADVSVSKDIEVDAPSGTG